MKSFFRTLLLLYVFLGIHLTNVFAQDIPINPSLIGKGTFLGETVPLRNLPALTPEEVEVMKQNALKKAAKKKIEPREYPFSETALPKGPDEVWQTTMGKSDGSKAPIVNFEAQTTTSYPPDCNGTVGPGHYMQTVNLTYAIYNRTGTLLAGPTALNTLFTGVPGASYNDGDPIVLYDEMADRWLVAEFTFGQTNDYMLVAVSTTNDPTGTWYKYSFDVVNEPDYPKFGVWQDGYYMGINNTSGNDIYVFERSKMLQGLTAQMVAFDNSWRPGSGFLCVPPLDNDGTSAPTGAPGMFIAFNDDAVTGGADQLWLYELTVNWITPASSTFVRSQQIGVTAFDSQFTASWDDISQPNSQKLDGVPQVIMNAPQYRNFGTYQTIVCCHTVDVDATNHAGIRWYELRKTSPATTWAIRQQGTYAPDANSRWMGSIMLNGSGKLGMGYSISSSSVYPGIRYCGQSASAYNSASGTMDIAEATIHSGTVAQTTYNRWGDYALMSIDPTDDQTFWFSTEYVKTGGSTKGTKVASFKFGNDPTVTTLAATSITGIAATLNGSVNPNGLATNYHFEWGTSISYGNNTTVVSAGSGSSNVSVSASISDLIAGTTYHFRLVATNSDGTSNGSDLTFVPGAATVTTTVASGITMISASSGGNVVSDGGAAVTARGVCWATTSNPTISGNHTTDGSGTGTFSSSITGLFSNTLYHVRAYATNSGGTYYGEDITFTTLCGIVNTFPWTEGFENAGLIPNCWTQEQVSGTGVLNWVFITGSGNSHPAASHGGTYNACLKDVTSADDKTRLVTPTINLISLENPVLTFWHTQAYWNPDQDQLAVYYKTSAVGSWTLLASYTSNVTTWTQRTISLPNGTDDYYIAFEGNAKYGYGVCVDDVSITGTYIPTWSGAISNNWSTAGNWTNNAIPATSANIIIPSSGVTNFPVISTSGIQCANLNILNGATVAINPDGELTVIGTLTNGNGINGIQILSDASGTGSLLHNTADVPGTIQRYITGSSNMNDFKYHFISIPLTTSNNSLSSFFMGSYLFDFSEIQNSWNQLGDETNIILDETKGYMIYYPAEFTTYELAGNMNYNAFSPTLTGISSANTRGWNLIPNPYPSSIDWDLVGTRSNVDNAIYIWPATGPGNSSNYYQYVSGISTPPGAMNGEVAVGQSFFVHANTSSPSITFNYSSRLHGTKPFLKNDSIVPYVFYLEASESGNKDNIAVRFTELASMQFDTDWDAFKLEGGINAPQLSTVSDDGFQLSINSLPVNCENVWVPLHFEIDHDAEVTFRASGFESFKSNNPIYLADRMLKKIINLKLNPEYSFTYNQTNENDRFMLKFAGQIGLEQPLSQMNGKVFVSGDLIYIDIPEMIDMQVNVDVYDAMGKRINNYIFTLSGIDPIAAPASPGVYIVRVQNGNQILTTKVVIN
jgi:hypothetical protein